MMSMRPLVVLLSVVVLAYCHTYLAQISVDGKAKGYDAHIRAGNPGGKGIYRDSPISDKSVFPRGILGANLTCGFLPYANNLAKPSSGKADVNPGSRITLQYFHETYNPQNPPNLNAFDVYIDPSHVGPIMVYMAKHSTSGVPSGNAWFKVFEDGYNAQTKTWGVTKMIQNGGKVDFNIPSNLMAGSYLVRTELLALHEGHIMYGAQSYPHCFEVNVQGNGNGQPDNFVALPGAYSYSDAGIFFSPYNGKNANYKAPGPAVARISGSGSTVPSTPVQTPTTPAQTPKPAPTTPTTPVQTPKPAPTTPVQPSPSDDTDTCDDLGKMKCLDSATYQICSRTRTGLEWSASVKCTTGRSCQQSGKYIYCL